MATKIFLSHLILLFALAFESCSTSTQSIATSPSTIIHAAPQRTEAVPARTVLQSKIDSILDDSLLAPCFTGVEIISLDDGKVLYERNSNKLFHPASNMKLLTAATGLHALGKDFRYTTHLYSDSMPSHGILRGNVYIKGSGDPLFTTDDLDTIALSLEAIGIRLITGDLVGDVSYFDSLSWGSGWMWDDEPDPDEAFITPLTVNDNSFEVTVEAGKKLGTPATVTLHPESRMFTVINTSVTTTDTLLPLLSVTRLNKENTLFIKGRIAPHAVPHQFSLSVWEPEMYFLDLFLSRLLDHGISVKGTTHIGTTTGKTILASRSHAIDTVMHKINKQSDNIAAENLLKTIGAEQREIPGSAFHALEEMKEYLASMGIDTSLLIIRDGSGVSWYNAVTPAMIVALLNAQYKDKQTFETFYGSLPIAGVDGTLEHRLVGTQAAGKVHAKTGTLTGNSAISGYVATADGTLLAFSILCTHFPREISILRGVQDAILELLANTKVSRE